MSVDDADLRKTLDIVDRHIEAAATNASGEATLSIAHSLVAITLMLRVAFEDEFIDDKEDELG